jgi:hypothetical protein
VTVGFAGFVNFSAMDPTLGGGGVRLPAFSVGVAGGGGGPALLGYDVYVSRGGGPYGLVGTLGTEIAEGAGGAAGEPLVLAPIGAGETVTMELAAVNVDGEGPRSAAVAVRVP